MTTTTTTSFEGHWRTAALCSTLVVYYSYCILLYFVVLHQYTFFYITIVLSVQESDLSTRGSPSNPQVHIKPVPIPMKTSGSPVKNPTHAYKHQSHAIIRESGHPHHNLEIHQLVSKSIHAQDCIWPTCQVADKAF